ncbi:alpha/beta fold hydrolase [Salinarimonas soli]|uniref:Alpha/beta hydrolase n=1 Tax=Salinarimonas soli TaxID=1638099 RepID=A0A5B2VG15_9HYPH|nr:alpha/beta hydrolase [Salinarimonas soli]KAA2238061.1 alpha/beta hydrolase [Salinarimonas soli]
MSHPTLPPAIDGERTTTLRRSGPLSYYVRGEGEPILLIHSINAAASAYEMRPLAHALQGRKVYVPDLPGFGFSDRSNRDYTIRLYTDAIHDMLDVIAHDEGEGAIDAVALSLSSEFLGRAAVERPAAFRTLAMITPTGFERGSSTRRGQTGSSREIPGLYKALTAPPWHTGLFNLLVSRRSIAFFLKRTFGSDNFGRDLLDYDYATSHQPGAENAPYAFVSGRLFARDIRTIYEALTLPVCVLHATRGDFKDFSEADWARARANWDFQAFDAGAMVHFEQLKPLLSAYEAFLARSGQPQPAVAF